jgi:chromosome segregation ATPase
MPCRDYYHDHPKDYYGPKLATLDEEVDKLKKQISFAESALCAALKAMELMEEAVADPGQGGDIFQWIDFKEAGITKKQLVAWRNKHAALDKKHRELEAKRLAAEQAKRDAEQRKKELQRSARSKLTPEELQALGVK